MHRYSMGMVRVTWLALLKLADVMTRMRAVPFGTIGKQIAEAKTPSSNSRAQNSRACSARWSVATQRMQSSAAGRACCREAAGA